MVKDNKYYSFLHRVSAICMMLALLWLTISAPFVFSAKQEIAQHHTTCHGVPGATDEDSTNPFGNNTEEKAPTSGNSFSEEYLHDHSKTDAFYLIISRCHNCENSDTYNAFHGELLVPPPNLV